MDLTHIKKVTPLDQAILNKLLAELEPGSAEILRSQLEEINVVDHSVDGKEAMFYKIRLFRSDLKRRRLFGFKHIEDLRVRAKIIVEGEAISIELCFVKGSFFSIVFPRDVSDLRLAQNVELELFHADFSA